MHFLAIATLAATVLAAPTTDSSRRLAKRSFQAQTNGRGLANNPLDEINFTHRKYGWEIIVVDSSEVGDEIISTTTVTLEPPAPFASSYTSGFATAQATATATAPFSNGTETTSAVGPTGTGSEDSSVAANPEENEKEYLSPVTIGGQKLNLNFDTGSADLWVFSNKLPQQEIGLHSIFDTTKSSSWQLLEGATWNISYGDGSGAGGIVGYDTVDVGGSTVDKQCVELATDISPEFVSDDNMDGLLGLAFQTINTVQPQPQKTFFENLMADLSLPVFTADLEEIGGKGTYEFGVINQTKYKGEIHYAPVDESQGFWQFDLPSYSINNQTQRCSVCAPAIADTGTSLIYLDQNIVDAYFSSVKSAQYSASYGSTVYKCSEKLPSLGVEIGGYMAEISSEEMVYAELDNGLCMAGLQPGPGDLQILGDVFLKQYFAVFDGTQGKPQFGIAEKDV